jgi:peptide methionine sulfoxide reductase MsrA
MDGEVSHATYRNHRRHAEAIEIVLNPSKVTYRDLVEFGLATPVGVRAEISFVILSGLPL